MAGLISYVGGMDESQPIDFDDMVTYLSNAMVGKIMASNGLNTTEAFLSLEQAKLSQEDLFKILTSVQNIYSDMPEKLGNIAHLWNGNRRKRPEFALEIAENMLYLYGINARKVRMYTEEEKRSGNASIIQFIGEDLVLPADVDYYNLAPLSLHDDILNVIFDKHGDTLINNIIGKRDYSVFGDKAAEAEKIIHESFEDNLKKLLPEFFARTLRTAYKSSYKLYDGVSEDSKNYNALFNKVEASIKNKSFDFNEIDDLYIVGSSFISGLPQDKTSLALLEAVALDSSVDPKNRAQAVYRITKYSSSFNRKLFAIPAEKFLNEHPEVLQNLELPDKEFGLIEDPLGSGNFVLDEKLLKIRRILSLNPPYISCVSIWDAANNFRIQNKEASLEKLIPFTQEASLKFETWSDDPNKSLSDLNSFISKSLKNLEKWEALNLRIKNKFISEGIPENQPVALAIQKYISEVSLNPNDRNDTITLINLDNLSDRLIWALKGEEYIQGAYYSATKEAELLKILSHIEDLHLKPLENKIIKIDKETLPSPFFLKNATRTTKEEAEYVAEILQDIADFVNETPLEKLPHLKKGAFGFTNDEQLKIDPQNYTYQAPQNIEIVKEKGIYFVKCEMAGYDFLFTKDSVETITRDSKNALPPFGAFMTAMLLQQQEGNNKVIIFTQSQEFLYASAVAAAMHGLTVEASDTEKVSLSLEQKAEVEKILEEYRRKNADFMADFKNHSPKYSHLNKKPKSIPELVKQTNQLYDSYFENIYNKAEISTYDQQRDEFLDELSKNKADFNKELSDLTDKIKIVRNFTMLKDEIKKAGGGEQNFLQILDRIKTKSLTKEDMLILEKISVEEKDLNEDAYQVYQQTIKHIEKALDKSNLSSKEKKALQKDFSYQTITPESLEKLVYAVLAYKKIKPKTEKDIPNMNIPDPSDVNEYKKYIYNQQKYLDKIYTDPEIKKYPKTLNIMKNYIANLPIEEKGVAYINTIKSIQRMRKANFSDEQYAILFSRDCYGSTVFDLNASQINPKEVQEKMFESCLFARKIADKIADFPVGEEKEKLQALLASAKPEYEQAVTTFLQTYNSDKTSLIDTLKDKKVSEDIIIDIEKGKISGFSLDTCIRAMQKDSLFSMAKFMEEHESMKKKAVLTIYEKNKNDIAHIKSEDMPEEAKRGLLIAYMSAANEIAESGDLYKVSAKELPALIDKKVSTILKNTLGEDIRGRKITIDEFNAMKAQKGVKETGWGNVVAERFNNYYR